jgi:RNA methyltransferase, TrmH family
MSGSLQSMIRDLGRRRGRERRGLALAEGVRLVEEAVSAAIEIRGAAVSPTLESTTRGRALKASLAERGVRLEELSVAELDELADTEHPQGIVAVIEPKVWSLADISTASGRPLLVLDGVQDPGNVGTMLRTAHALGAAGVVALKGTAELTNTKVLRGGMGAPFKFPVLAADDEEFLAWCGPNGVTLWATAGDGEPFNRSALSGAGTLGIIVGNEGAGVRPSIAAAASRRVAIPLRPDAESLNVAIAAGILLYEVQRDV